MLPHKHQQEVGREERQLRLQVALKDDQQEWPQHQQPLLGIQTKTICIHEHLI
jgi:hypothetical protein